MQVERVNIYRITLPFQGRFAISRLDGRSSTRIVVEVSAEQGRIHGYGEGVPIEFVTGETAETVVRDVASFVSEGFFPRRLTDVSQIWGFVERLPRGKEHHAALCALEMALLDALGKEQERSILDYLPQQFSTPCIHYGASITLGERARIEQLCQMIKSIGMRHVRIKMGSDFEQNLMTLETVREVLGTDCEQRADPNGVWDFDLAMRHLPLLTHYRVQVIEEPMERTSPGFPEFAQAARASGLTLMACESAPTLPEVKAIIHEGHYGIFNVKLCRSGGFRRTLRIIDHLRREKIPFQIGCTLGEAGLLSAAGRALSLVCSDAVTYDGSYDRFMLKENITEEDVTFGQGGKAGPLGGHGLGVTVSSEKLSRLSNFSCFVSLKRAC
jgi:L-alanine-DL-glutamate epimerase-like enolase superfamily enzyme